MTSDSRFKTCSRFKCKFRSPVSFHELLWSNLSFQGCYESFGISIATDSNPSCFCPTVQESFLHLFWECSITEAFWNRAHLYFVSVNLIPASLFDHCLPLGRYYIYSCKYKNVRPSSIEYVNQIRWNHARFNSYRKTKHIPTEVVQHNSLISPLNYSLSSQVYLNDI